MSRITASGRVEGHGPDSQVRIALDNAAGWDVADRISTVSLPRQPRVSGQPFDGPNLPPVGAHVTLSLEWKP